MTYTASTSLTGNDGTVVLVLHHQRQFRQGRRVHDRRFDGGGEERGWVSYWLFYGLFYGLFCWLFCWVFCRVFFLARPHPLKHIDGQELGGVKFVGRGVIPATQHPVQGRVVCKTTERRKIRRWCYVYL